MAYKKGETYPDIISKKARCTMQVYQASTWSDNKFRELIAVKALHTSLLNTTVLAFKILPLWKLCTDARA